MHANSLTHTLICGTFPGDAWTSSAVSECKIINGCQFSTQNHNNDSSSGNCALYRKAGWWYNVCCEGTLTGTWNGTLKWNNYIHLKYVDFIIKVK